MVYINIYIYIFHIKITILNIINRFCPRCFATESKEDDYQPNRTSILPKTSPSLTVKAPKDSDYVNKIKKALRALGKYTFEIPLKSIILKLEIGGAGTGEQITRWLIENEGVVGDKKVLKYRTNATLSCKAYTDIFEKELPNETRKKSLWKLKDLSDEPVISGNVAIIYIENK